MRLDLVLVIVGSCAQKTLYLYNCVRQSCVYTYVHYYMRDFSFCRSKKKETRTEKYVSGSVSSISTSKHAPISQTPKNIYIFKHFLYTTHTKLSLPPKSWNIFGISLILCIQKHSLLLGFVCVGLIVLKPIINYTKFLSSYNQK